jgi:hypothetical protein
MHVTYVSIYICIGACNVRTYVCVCVCILKISLQPHADHMCSIELREAVIQGLQANLAARCGKIWKRGKMKMKGTLCLSVTSKR